MRRDVFQAIADPTRREIISLIATRHLNLNSIAGEFNISRPAISKHIRILNECGLIRIRKEGRERYCEAKLSSLHEVAGWVAQYRQFWELKLDALEKYLETIQEKNATGKKKAGKRK
jgi:DNA-binding transcriptional ArsR family regulator